MRNTDPIGVFDSGVGGFTVVKALQELLPGEDIIYYGDTANMPYGDRSTDDIVHLTRQILDFISSFRPKAVAVACNTISALISRYSDGYPFKIFSVVESGAQAVKDVVADCVGVFGTSVTINSHKYDDLIHALRPEMTVVSSICPRLSPAIERGDFSRGTIDPQLVEAIENMRRTADVKHVVFGCTHYPLIADHLSRLYPDIAQIDPAYEEADAVREYLSSIDMLNPAAEGALKAYTSGGAEHFAEFARSVLPRAPMSVERLSVAEPL